MNSTESTTKPASFPTAKMLGILLVVSLISLNLFILIRIKTVEAQFSKQQAFWTLCQGVSSATQRAAFFTSLVAELHSEWRSANLRNLDLEGSNLANRNLSMADFTGTKFVKTDLTQAMLKASRLDLCDCSSTNFEGSVLDEVQLFKSRIDNANFRSATMVSAVLEQCSGDNVNFVRANLTGALLSMANLSNADFTGANLSGASLEGATLQGANLALAEFKDTNITDVDFTGANWWRSRGLSRDQLHFLADTFPATETDKKNRQRDFKLWLQGFQ